MKPEDSPELAVLPPQTDFKFANSTGDSDVKRHAKPQIVGSGAVTTSPASIPDVLTAMVPTAILATACILATTVKAQEVRNPLPHPPVSSKAKTHSQPHEMLPARTAIESILEFVQATPTEEQR